MTDVRDVAERYYERFAAGDLEGAASLFADGCPTVTPAGTFDPAEHAEFSRAFRAALPDARMEVVAAVESGDEIFLIGRFRGTHRGDLVSPQGTLPASGNAIDVRFADYFRVEGGAVTAHEVFWDQVDMLGQLGAGPPA